MKQTSTPNNVQRIYSGLVADEKLEADPAQRALAARLDQLLGALEQRRLSSKKSALGWLFGSERSGKLKGLYIHGKVGRGKSMLMDIFFDLAPGESKRRTHFNEFMADVHDRINEQRQAFGRGETKEADPIRPVGLMLARQAMLLCFDEFAVTDIADAMILGRLFQVLFEKGVIVVATSNVMPDKLYHNGLNRQLFAPFIDMLKTSCDVFELDTAEDFRLAKIERGQAFLSPLNKATKTTMETIWRKLCADASPVGEDTLHVKGRQFHVRRFCAGSVWFTFDELCNEPRGARDFLEIAKRFDTVFIENVPIMNRSMRNQAKRFILLVDTLYDRRVRTVISAEANPHALYAAGSGTEAFEFQRTASRLIEMQSKSYQKKFLYGSDAKKVS